MNIPLTEQSWPKAYRIVSSRFPPMGVFDKVADAADLEAVFYIESLTNPRIRAEIGQIELVRSEDVLTGPGTTPIMAAFTHLNPSGSRFSNGECGVYYAANTQRTAITETVFHVERWAKESSDPATSFVMRVYIGCLNQHPYHDLRGQAAVHPELFDPSPLKYGSAQQLAAQLRNENSWGLLYDSVREPSGECIAAFRPPALGSVHQSQHLAYCWDGQRVAEVLELRSVNFPGETGSL